MGVGGRIQAGDAMSIGRAPWRYTKCDPIDDDDRGDVALDYKGAGYSENPMIVDVDGNKVVGNGEYHVFGAENRVDNVRLLLAAPKLLEMLEKIYDAEFGFGAWPSNSEISALLVDAKGKVPE
jgi:hypothetical protein